jgi:uncharacterized protein (DUF924 family)
MRPWAADILHFWFFELRPDQWFGRSDSVDAELRRRFGRWLEALGGQPADAFLSDPPTTRAAVLLFDQCPRNLFRDNARAFAYDPLARAICKGAVARGWDRGLSVPERQFLYMPLMHSEAKADQLLSLHLFGALGDSFVFGFARMHARMVLRFGRFPHRNAALGRRSTPAETRAVAEGNAW